MKIFFIILCFGLHSITTAADQSQQPEDNKIIQKRDKYDYAQQQMRARVIPSIIISRLHDMLEAAEGIAVYTENPPRITIRLNDTDTVTATGSIAQKAYERSQHKNNSCSYKELMQQISELNSAESKNQ